MDITSAMRIATAFEVSLLDILPGLRSVAEKEAERRIEAERVAEERSAYAAKSEQSLRDALEENRRLRDEIARLKTKT